MLLDNLPEVGLRAKWHTDSSWRGFLLCTPRAWSCGWLGVEIKADVTEEALKWFHLAQPWPMSRLLLECHCDRCRPAPVASAPN